MLSKQVQRKNEDLEEKGELPESPKKRARTRRNHNKAFLAYTGPAALNTQKELKVRESALFRPLQPIGVVTNGLPFGHVTLGSVDYVLTSTGRNVQVHDCKDLQVREVGPRLVEKVRAILCHGIVSIVALRKDIVAFFKFVQICRFCGHTQPATTMCKIGTIHLVSSSGREVFVWNLANMHDNQQRESKDIQRNTPQGALDMGPDEICTAMCHPPTYVNKVVMGSKSGLIQLWNVEARELVHTFHAHRKGNRAVAAVTCLCESPNTIDLVACGFGSGRIVLLNVREDRVVLEFEQVEGRVLGMSFRADAGGPAQLVSATSDGKFIVWDLEKRRMSHAEKDAHCGPVTSVHFLPESAILITGGCDNAIRQWVFDTADGRPRRSRERCGCPGPVRHINFYGDPIDEELMVSGENNGTGFLSRMCLRNATSYVYSQKNAQHLPFTAIPCLPDCKLPPMVDLAYSELRHDDWPAVISCHEHTPSALLWSAGHRAMAPKYLLPPSEDSKRLCVTSVAMSICGNYCLLGLEDGALHRFNTQSQMYRGPIPSKKILDEDQPDKDPGPPERAHRGMISGLAITNEFQVLSVSSHPGDCVLRVWGLTTHKHVMDIPLSEGRSAWASCLRLRLLGVLVAIALDDGGILVVDLNGGLVVRTFEAGMPAVDLKFSNDGRWIAVALRAGGVRVFDLPAARCIDSFIFSRPAIAVCFSPNSTFLLTAHTKGFGIQVWANKYLFDPSVLQPLLQPEPKEPVMVDEPGDDDDGAVNDAKNPMVEDVKASTATEEATVSSKRRLEPVKPLEPHLLTLSGEPPAKWQAILNLDLVKERNKPTEPVKPLPNAPFFIPTAYDGVTPRLKAAEEQEDGIGTEAEEKLQSRRLAHFTGEVTPFQKQLRASHFDRALKYLQAQTASGVHLAIEQIGPLAGGDVEELAAGLRFFAYHLDQAHCADEVQAYLGLFLKAHGEDLSAHAELRSLCGTVLQAQEKRWTDLDRRCQKARCFLGMLTHTQSSW